MPLSGTPRAPRFGRMRNLAQIVSGALIGSLVMLTAVVYVAMGQVAEAGDLAPAPLVFAGAALSVLCAAAGILLPALMEQRTPREHLALRLSGYAYSRLLFAACFEAAGLFWAILGLLLQEPACLIGPVVAIAVMVAYFPTQRRMEQAIGMSEEEADRALGHPD